MLLAVYDRISSHMQLHYVIFRINGLGCLMQRCFLQIYAWVIFALKTHITGPLTLSTSMQQHCLYKISGDISSPYYARAKRCAELLKASLHLDENAIEYDPRKSDEWDKYLEHICEKLNYTPSDEQGTSVLVWIPLTKSVIGGEKQFRDLLYAKYGISSDLPWEDYITLAQHAETLHMEALAAQAQLRPVYSLVIPPFRNWQRIGIAQQVASRLSFTLICGAAAVRVRSTEYPPIWGMPHHEHCNVEERCDVDSDRYMVSGVTSTNINAETYHTSSQLSTATTAAVLRRQWATEGIAEELNLLQEAGDTATKAVLLLNAPRDAQQWSLLSEYACSLQGVVAVDGSDDTDVGAGEEVAKQKERWSDFKQWGRELVKRAQEENSEVVYVCDVKAETSTEEVVNRIVAAFETLMRSK